MRPQTFLFTRRQPRSTLGTAVIGLRLCPLYRPRCVGITVVASQAENSRSDLLCSFSGRMTSIYVYIRIVTDSVYSTRREPHRVQVECFRAISWVAQNVNLDRHWILLKWLDHPGCKSQDINGLNRWTRYQKHPPPPTKPHNTEFNTELQERFI
jgi:hypothetical protein